MPSEFDDEGVTFTEYWNCLSIHKATCDKHTTTFPPQITQLWKDLVMMLEDTKPPDWIEVTEALLAVPLDAQREFMAEGSKVLKSGLNPKHRWSIKNYGVVYHANGELALLAGQIYVRLSTEQLQNWAVGLYGEEFKGQPAYCIVISIDQESARPATVHLLNQSVLRTQS